MDCSRFLMIGIDGYELSPELERFLRGNKIFGVILFSRNYKNISQLKKLVSDIRDAASGDIAIGVDHEGGRVLRFGEPFAKILPMAELARMKNGIEAVRDAADIIGRELFDAGMDINFAPVVDILFPQGDAIIGDRSFSSDPNEVAKFAEVFITSMQSHGVAACAKHFPGHGAATADSHLTLPCLDRTKNELRTCEFIPFEAAARAGVASMMTAHLLVPDIDPSLPASLSPSSIDMLRKEIGFNGIVFSDDLTMGGITNGFDVAVASWMALAAGSDIAMICSVDLDVHVRAISAIESALADGRLSESSLSKSLERMKRFPVIKNR